MLSLGFGARYDLPVSAQRIHGFVVAADEKGTRAMSVVFEGGQVSKMVGAWRAEHRCSVTWQTVGSAAVEIMGATLRVMVWIEHRLFKDLEALLMLTYPPSKPYVTQVTPSSIYGGQ